MVPIPEVFFGLNSQMVKIGQTEVNILSNRYQLYIVAAKRLAKRCNLAVVGNFLVISYAVHIHLQVLAVSVRPIVSNVNALVLLLDLVDET
jgi:hypothetical protein